MWKHVHITSENQQTIRDSGSFIFVLLKVRRITVTIFDACFPAQQTVFSEKKKKQEKPSEVKTNTQTKYRQQYQKASGLEKAKGVQV